MTNPGVETTDNNAIRELRDSVKELNNSTKISSLVMTGLTFAIFALTVILVLQGME